MTFLRYLFAAMGALSILGALLPGARVSPGRFSQAPTPPLSRLARGMMLVFGAVCLGLAAACGGA